MNKKIIGNLNFKLSSYADEIQGKWIACSGKGNIKESGKNV